MVDCDHNCRRLKPRLHRDSDPDPDPDWLRLHGGKLDSNPDSDHLSHVDCDPDSNLIKRQELDYMEYCTSTIE